MIILTYALRSGIIFCHGTTWTMTDLSKTMNNVCQKHAVSVHFSTFTTFTDSAVNYIAVPDVQRTSRYSFPLKQRQEPLVRVIHECHRHWSNGGFIFEYSGLNSPSGGTDKVQDEEVERERNKGIFR